MVPQGCTGLRSSVTETLGVESSSCARPGAACAQCSGPEVTPRTSCHGTGLVPSGRLRSPPAFVRLSGQNRPGGAARLSCRLPRAHSPAAHRFAASSQQRFTGQNLSCQEGGGNELDLGEQEVSGCKDS